MNKLVRNTKRAAWATIAPYLVTMRLAVLSDAHANLPGIKAIINDARSHSVDAIWNLGDSIDYGPSPNEVIGLLRREVELHLAGNHELLLAGKLAPEDFSDLALHCNAWTNKCISDKNRSWIEHLVPRQDTCAGARRFTLAHGSPLDPAWDYLRDRAQVCAALAACEGADFILAGHTHAQQAWRERGDLIEKGKSDAVRCLMFKPNTPFSTKGDRFVITVGAAITSDPDDRRAGYLLLDLPAHTAELRRVEYDREEAQAAYKGTDLPPALARMI